jgi:hypothetical protein
MVFLNILIRFLVVSGLTVPLPPLGLQAGCLDCLSASFLDTLCDPPDTSVADS